MSIFTQELLFCSALGEPGSIPTGKVILFVVDLTQKFAQLELK
jgi:hypothetical protein